MGARYLYLDDQGEKGYRESIDESSGSDDTGKIVSTNSEGKIDSSFLEDGLGGPTRSPVMNAPEALSQGTMVEIHQILNRDGHEIQVIRKADNASKIKAHGYIKEDVENNAHVYVYFKGKVEGLSGLTPGKRVFLGEDGGVITTSLNPNTTTGKIVQPLGIASSDTTFEFHPGPPIEL